MRRGGGKGKGSGFERQIAKALSLWLTHGKDSTQLIRSVLSGGWSARDWRHVGDLAPNGPIGELFRREFAIECKHRKEIDLYGLWTRSDDGGTLSGWWTKLVADSKAAELTPMLIFRSNNMPIMVGALTDAKALLPVHAHELLSRVPVVAKAAIFPWYRLAIFPFEALLKCSPEQFLAKE